MDGWGTQRDGRVQNNDRRNLDGGNVCTLGLLKGTRAEPSHTLAEKGEGGP